MDFKEHIKILGERYGKNLVTISEKLQGGGGRESLTRNSLFVKLKKESVKVGYLPQLAEAIGCTTAELLIPPDGFEHVYTKNNQYQGLRRIKAPN